MRTSVQLGGPSWRRLLDFLSPGLGDNRKLPAMCKAAADGALFAERLAKACDLHVLDIWNVLESGLAKTSIRGQRVMYKFQWQVFQNLKIGPTSLRTHRRQLSIEIGMQHDAALSTVSTF